MFTKSLVGREEITWPSSIVYNFGKHSCGHRRIWIKAKRPGSPIQWPTVPYILYGSRQAAAHMRSQPSVLGLSCRLCLAASANRRRTGELRRASQDGMISRPDKAASRARPACNVTSLTNAVLPRRPAPSKSFGVHRSSSLTTQSRSFLFLRVHCSTSRNHRNISLLMMIVLFSDSDLL